MSRTRYIANALERAGLLSSDHERTVVAMDIDSCLSPVSTADDRFAVALSGLAWAVARLDDDDCYAAKTFRYLTEPQVIPDGRTTP